MNKIPPKTLLIFSSLLSLSFAALIAYEFYDIRNMNREASEMKIGYEERTKDDSLAQSIRSIQNIAKEDIETFENIKLDQAKLVSFIELVETTASKLSLSSNISSVSVDSSNEKEKKVNIIVETNGGWSGSIGFIRALDNLPYGARIDNTNLSKGGNPSSPEQSSSGWRTSTTITVPLFD